ncbi:long-chain fatty acid--CoA ligase [Erythrobacteraceae bacterium E2-1 Yellow Sea]|nr:long-chain fatty acid--CoA ligase [Erythrobacteraceae bacterium E2-1 Yellow Sea]
MSVSGPSSYHHPVPWGMEFEALSLPSLLQRGAERHGNAVLVDFAGRRFTYAEIWADARRFAAGLMAQGVKKGDRIGLFLPNVPIYPVAYYGAMLAGAVVVNFSPLYTAEELSQQVADSGVQCMVTVDVTALLDTAVKVLDASALEQLIVGRLGQMLPVPKRLALKVLGRGKVSKLPGRTDVVDWRDMLAKSDEQVELPIIDPLTDLALLQYTGGTTGVPKGAMLTHENLSINAQQVDAIDPFDRSEPDIIVGALPLFHVFANTAVLNRTVVRGGRIVMLARFTAAEALKLVRRTWPNSFPGVPTMFQAMLDEKGIEAVDFSSLRVCISGGAPLPAPLREKFEAITGARLVEGYGLTESSGVVSVNPYQGQRKPGTIGQPLPQTQVRLLDKEDPTRDAQAGEPGELAVAGPQVMQGYWNRPDADADVFVEIEGTRWLRTGDIAVIDDDGFIAIVDRSKDMIAVGGFKVFPSQVETVLLQNDAVKEALVLGLRDDYLGERPHGYVTLNDGAEISGDALMKWVNTRLGKHERLASLTVRDELPKTMIGKLDRKALKAEVLGE